MAGMNDVDEKCYESRYTDLEGMPGREHFIEFGNNRLPTCA